MVHLRFRILLSKVNLYLDTIEEFLTVALSTTRRLIILYK